MADLMTHAEDTRDPATSDALVQAAVDTFGRLDTVVANAAVGFYGGSAEEAHCRAAFDQVVPRLAATA